MMHRVAMRSWNRILFLQNTCHWTSQIAMTHSALQTGPNVKYIIQFSMHLLATLPLIKYRMLLASLCGRFRVPFWQDLLPSALPNIAKNQSACSQQS
jgi:hypothetical protein